MLMIKICVHTLNIIYLEMQDIRVQVDLVNVETCAEPVVVVGHHLLTVRLSSHMIITIINIINITIIIIN